MRLTGSSVSAAVPQPEVALPSINSRSFLSQPQQIGTESRTETSMMFYRDFTGAVHTLVEQYLYINQREVINEDVLKST